MTGFLLYFLWAALLTLAVGAIAAGGSARLAVRSFVGLFRGSGDSEVDE